MPTVEVFLVPESRDGEIVRRALDEVIRSCNLTRISVRSGFDLCLPEARRSKFLGKGVVGAIAQRLTVSPQELLRANKESPLPSVA